VSLTRDDHRCHPKKKAGWGGDHVDMLDVVSPVLAIWAPLTHLRVSDIPSHVIDFEMCPVLFKFDPRGEIPGYVRASSWFARVGEREEEGSLW
jgi:hypothetical protein